MIRARFSVLLVLSAEEWRVIDFLATWHKTRKGLSGQVYLWSCTEGLVPHRPEARSAPPKPDDDTRGIAPALDRVLAARPNDGIIYIFRDIHHHIKAPEVLRRLRDCAHRLRGSKNTLILLSPKMTVPEDLEKEVPVIDYPLPTQEEIGLLVDRNYREFLANPERQEHGLVDQYAENRELRSAIIQACRGLTETEVDDALAKAVIECGGFRTDVIDSIQRTKRNVIKRTRCLEAVDALEGMEDVGGLANLKQWVEKRRRIWWDERARAFVGRYPKGILALGMPGGGKGLAVRAVAHAFRLPLYRLDMGSVFGGVVGESESNLRTALKIIEAVAPCVLWIDEIEKGLAGVRSSNRSDGGTAARVFGHFLTWLQEKQAPVFCYFTANDVSDLPPELMRKGRVDEIFFVDIPNYAEREEILAIHLRKRGRRPDQFDLTMLAGECAGFVGAEIEQVIDDALFDALADGSADVTDRHIIEAFRRTAPLLKVQREQIERLLAWVETGRAVRASAGEREDLRALFQDPIDPATL